ncbi:MAG: ATP-binding cassette domain-containing protein [Bacteroidia bacterium]|nr:ATP-binding cassette domain-containing protein [Bacteroidia bacterium]
MNKQNAVVSVDRIRHQFDNKIVLADISYSFTKNNVTAILGRSGSGKSTLLKILNGLIQPNEGIVTLFDKPIDYKNMQSTRLQMGYVIQQVGLFPHMDIRSNIDLLGKVTHQAKEAMQTRVQQLMDMVQLPHEYSKKYPHELSGGEQQRVGLCRAMFLNPPVLLMDEPFGSLDYETKRNIYQHLMVIQHKEPRTIILVTHDWDEAITLADQFVWIENGKIKADGNTDDLKKLKVSNAL